MKLPAFCEQCQNLTRSLETGQSCGLDVHLSGDAQSCPQFSEKIAAIGLQIPTQDDLKADPVDDPRSALQKIDAEIKDKLKKWGLGLIALGVIHFVIPALDSYFGALILILGILNLAIPHRAMFIANGVGLILTGVLNLAGSVLPGGGGAGAWTIFGFFQIYWGYKEIKKYREYAEEMKELVPEGTYPEKHSAAGWISFATGTFSFALFLMLNLILQSKGEQIAGAHSYIFLGAFGLTMIMALSGIISGIIGVLIKERKKVLAITGLVLSLFIPFLFGIGLFA